MNDADLDDSWVVAGLTWVLYLGWLSVLAGVALWIGVEPLPSVQARIPGPGGTVAALGVGVAFILVSRQLYDALRRRYRARSDPEPEPAAGAGPAAGSTGSGEPQAQRPRKKGRKGRSKKKRGY